MILHTNKWCVLTSDQNLQIFFKSTTLLWCINVNLSVLLSELTFTKCVYVFYLCSNSVFKHKMNFCADVVRMVCFPCVWLCFICVLLKTTHMNIGFGCVYFEFTLLLNSQWTQKWFQVSTSWIRKYPGHTLAPICWGVMMKQDDDNDDRHIDGIVQYYSNSISNALKLLKSCTNPSIYWLLLLLPLCNMVYKRWDKHLTCHTDLVHLTYLKGPLGCVTQNHYAVKSH